MLKKIISKFKKKLKEELISEIEQKLKEENNKKLQELIIEAFNDDSDSKRVYWFDGFSQTILTSVGNIKESMVKKAEDSFNENYKDTVNDFLRSEEFIDRMVERIIKKQLK